jgi:hypothetical protein
MLPNMLERLKAAIAVYRQADRSTRKQHKEWRVSNETIVQLYAAQRLIHEQLGVYPQEAVVLTFALQLLNEALQDEVLRCAIDNALDTALEPLETAMFEATHGFQDESVEQHAPQEGEDF